jgi:LPXTG-motif cell wall-anchored protein
MAAVVAASSVWLLCLASAAVADVVSSTEPETQVQAIAEDPCADDHSKVRACAAQDAGEEQYEDPFAESKPPPESSGQPSASEDSQSSAPASSSPADPLADGVPTDAAAAPGGATLPNTGMGTGGLLSLGIAMLVGGVVLHRLSRPRAAATPAQLA